MKYNINENLQKIGKLDINKLGIYKSKVITDEVILTNERITHIKEHHPGDYENYGKYMKEIIKIPDYILEDNKNIDTVFFMKKIKENDKNIKLVIRLNTNSKEKQKSNSVLTFWKVKEKTYNQLIRNKTIIWKNIDKNE